MLDGCTYLYDFDRDSVTATIYRDDIFEPSVNLSRGLKSSTCAACLKREIRANSGFSIQVPDHNGCGYSTSNSSNLGYQRISILEGFKIRA